MLRSSAFSFLTDHTPRLEWNVGHVVEALFLVWKVAWAAEDTWDESSHFEALPLHLQPLPFQVQDQSLVQNHLPKLLRGQDGNVSSNCLAQLLAH